ncbi:MAG: hypothetical protein LC715_06190 [Gammaproteobacteria bacterium]|nr:hypothetical protein [Gammaproteobacteria bacterium]
MKRFKTWLLLLLAAFALAGCASGGRQMSELDKAQYAYSAAIRWGDFEGAWQLVDPEFRKAHPMTDLQFARYQQIQISGYRDLAATVSADNTTAAREIQIGVINKHNMTERSTRYTERWRYDPQAKSWWLTVGLPDFWQGE